MKKHLHNSDELFESPQYGWEQLQFLLEKRLPQENEKNTKGIYLPYIIAASLITVLLFSSLVIYNAGHPHNFGKNITASANVLQENMPVATGSPTKRPQTNPGNKGPLLIPYVSNTTSRKSGAGHFNNKEQDHAGDPAWLRPALAGRRTPGPGIHRQIAGQLSVIHLPAKTTIAAIKPANADRMTLTTKTADKPKQKQQHTWGLSAGLAMNAMIGQEQNLRPFPVAELRYNVSGNFFLSMGLAVASPISSSSRAVVKTVYLNDTTNNVYFYNNVKQYSRLLYADIPLMTGINISKHISLQGGVQASVLLNAKSKTSVEPYDFQMALSSWFPDNLAPGSAVRENKYAVKARKTDYRFITGIKYSINKASFNLTYQYSPRTVLVGEHVSRDKNQLLTLSAQFKIK